jgi:hypothetical protein
VKNSSPALERNQNGGGRQTNCFDDPDDLSFARGGAQMSTVPPPLPTARRQCCNRFPAFVTGLVIGAVAVGIVATGFIRREQARTQAAIAEALATRGQVGHVFDNLIGDGLAPLAGASSSTPATGPKTSAEMVKALGDESVDDLRQGRLLAVYNLTTPDYKKRVKREEFDKMVNEVPNVRLIYSASQQRESKVRQSLEGKGYEYYCSSGGNFSGNVVVSFLFEPGDNGNWRIGKFEINYTNR